MHEWKNTRGLMYFFSSVSGIVVVLLLLIVVVVVVLVGMVNRCHKLNVMHHHHHRSRVRVRVLYTTLDSLMSHCHLVHLRQIPRLFSQPIFSVLHGALRAHHVPFVVEQSSLLVADPLPSSPQPACREHTQTNTHTHTRTARHENAYVYVSAELWRSVVACSIAASRVTHSI